jgi:succinyl-diaminopimelate desuccinylase
MDPIKLSQDLIRCPSITPHNAGALEVVERHLISLDFTCERLDFEGIANLYAQKGNGRPRLCFAGHTDVVPVGAENLWTENPFEGTIKDGQLWGRGAADMKCAIAAFISALSDFKTETPISLLITGDEEGEALHGTQRLLPLLAERGLIPDLCLIGEPTALNEIGDTIKIGRRGSITGQLTCFGKQGHIAYPQNTDNPIPRLLTCLQELYAYPFDEGTEVFEPTRFETTSIDVGNLATNIIPQKAEARFGIRINTLQKAEELAERISSLCYKMAGKHDLQLTIHGNAYLTDDKKNIQLVQEAIKKVTGALPVLSTTGGTTDGRFISTYCPVIECGLLETTMHQVDEHVSLKDILRLKEIYLSILHGFLPESSTSGTENSTD